jgi:hypothetical protein
VPGWAGLAREGAGPPGRKRERGAGAEEMRPTPGKTPGSCPAGIKNWPAQPGLAVPAQVAICRPESPIPAQPHFNPAWTLIIWPGDL